MGEFEIEEIGEDEISTIEALRDKLDALDDIPGNVVLSNQNGAAPPGHSY